MRRIASGLLVALVLYGCNAILGNERASGIDDEFDTNDSGADATTTSADGETGAAVQPAAAIELAKGFEAPARGLVLDGTYAYFSAGKSIYRVSHDGSGLTKWLTSLADPHGLARNGDELLFTQSTGDGGAAARVRVVDGGGRANSGAPPSAPEHAIRSLTVASDRAYVTDIKAQDVYRYDLGNWSTAPYISYSGSGNDEPWDVVVVSGDVFFTLRRGCTADGSVYRASSGPFSRFADKEKCPQGITADSAGNVYWTSGGAGGAIRRKAATGFGEPTTLVPDQANPVAIIADDSFIYWANGGAGNGSADGSICRASHDGRDLTVLATGVTNPTALALAADGIYWLEAGPAARLMKLAK